MASGKARLLLAVLLAGLCVAVAPAAPRRDRARTGGRPPMLVTLMHHHSTRGISQNALPILEAAGGTGTLAVMILELPRTLVPPDDVSLPDQPGGMGNVQPLSLGEPDADGLWTGRLNLEQPEKFMREEDLRHLAAAGWEVTFHGADHTPQSILVEQVDGPAKLARAYAATTAEIRRILQDPAYPIRTNTLASNGWSAAVRQVAREHFDWSEVAWAGSHQHVPVVFSSALDLHGDLNSVDFQRAAYDGPEDIQELVRLAHTGGGGWLIIQLHDVVDQLEDSSDPPRAMLVDEYRLMVESLDAAGVRFVTFAEGAERIQRDIAGNLFRNNFFGRHPFKERNDRVRLDWTSSAAEAQGGAVDYQEDGTMRFTSQEMSRLTAQQQISPGFLNQRTYVLRLKSDLTQVQGGLIRIMIKGPAGERSQTLPSGSASSCMEFGAWEVVGSPRQSGPVEFSLYAEQFTGTALVGSLSLEALQPGVHSCRFDKGRPRR